MNVWLAWAAMVQCAACAAILAVMGCSRAPAPQATDPSRPAPHARPTASQALERGINWLVNQQAADGGWHSSTYGQMRAGVGNTALAVYAISRSPDARQPERRACLERGLQFLFAQPTPQSPLPATSGSADYPNYAAALVVLALERIELREFAGEQARLVEYLRQTQHSERQGWSERDADYGGWQISNAGPTDARLPGMTNLSVTAFALAALEAAGALDDDVRKRAVIYLARCQNQGEATTKDGGFFFTPVADDPLNKAGWIAGPSGEPRARSYGSTTADGVVALAACGAQLEDPRLVAARDWLTGDPTLEHVPGFPVPEAAGTSDEDRSRDALLFYYYSALARAYVALPVISSTERCNALAAALIDRQQPDGSWRSDVALMREDDPLIATSLAVAALGLLVEAEVGETNE